MIREALVAFALLILVMGGTAVAAAPSLVPPPPVQWKAVEGNPNVTIDQPIQLIVYGPPRGNFTIQVEGQPFNHTYPSIVNSYQLPNGTPGNATSMEVTLSTKTLGFGGYLVFVNNTTIPLTIALFLYYVILPGNITRIEQNVTQLWLWLNISLARESALLQKIGVLEIQQEEYFWISVAEFIVLCAIIAITKTRLSQSRFGRWIRQIWHKLWWGRRDSDPFTSGSSSGTNPVPKADPTRIWVSSRLFRGCDACTTPFTELQRILHLRQDHKIPDPKRGLHYEVAQDAIQRALSSRSDIQPAAGRVRKALEEIPKDVFKGAPGMD